MKLSFSTGGWPFSLEESMNLAREMNYDGLEISAKSLGIFERSGAPFSPASRQGWSCRSATSVLMKSVY